MHYVRVRRIGHRPVTLTIATDSPAYEPWFSDDDPANGEGFEGAVAKAVYEKLGYRAGQVEFVRVPWGEAMAPGPKNFDFDINQFTIVGERRDTVDFSSPYYAVAQSIVAMTGTPAASDLPKSTLVGQFPRPNSVTEFFGLLLEKGSPMTPCASAAVDTLYADGTLDLLAQTWLVDTGGAPFLE